MVGLVLIYWASGALGMPFGGQLLNILAGVFVFTGLFSAAVVWHVPRDSALRHLERVTSDRSDLDLKMITVAEALHESGKPVDDARVERMTAAVAALDVEVRKARVAGGTPAEIIAFIEHELTKDGDIDRCDDAVAGPVLRYLADLPDRIARIDSEAESADDV